MRWDPTRPANTRAARTMRDRVLREEPECGATRASCRVSTWSR